MYQHALVESPGGSVSNANNPKSTVAELDALLDYVDSSRGLKLQVAEVGRVRVKQELDGKVFSFAAEDVAETLQRKDSDGKAFIQLNFKNNFKVLFTDTLIGFKPVEIVGLDISRIPKVVTTPDLLSVFEAIEESMGAESGAENEVEILKKVYFSILSGGEQVGFELDGERAWHNRLIASRSKASA
jgi:hypothetical protein